MSGLTREDLRIAARALDREAWRCERKAVQGVTDKIRQRARQEAAEFRRVEDRVRINAAIQSRQRHAAGGAS